MSRRWRNFFFLFGVAAIIVMLFTLDSTVSEIGEIVRTAGGKLLLLILLWVPIYLMNALAWYLIIRDDCRSGVPFMQVFKMSVTGFALNYVTPFGLMGGEPYRIMELTPYVGAAKASSSVILYVMMHICSHFCFWLSAIAVYVTLHFCVGGMYVLNWWTGLVLTVLTIVFLLVCWLFSRGFRHGFVVKVFGLLGRLPLVRRWAVPFLDSHSEQLQRIDGQIRHLHGEGHGKPFWGSLLLEYSARVLGCVEYWILLRLLVPDATFLDSFVISAFSSCFSNMLFIMPMQLGAREGGLALAAASISLPGSVGLSVSLMTRIREFVWIVIGVGIMKLGNKVKSDDKGSAS